MLRKKPKQFKLIIKTKKNVLIDMPHSKNPGILAALNSDAVQFVLKRFNIT